MENILIVYKAICNYLGYLINAHAKYAPRTFSTLSHEWSLCNGYSYYGTKRSNLFELIIILRIVLTIILYL